MALTGSDWIHEVKHDGFRMQAHLRDGRVRLLMITGVDWTNRYPLIVKGDEPN